MVTVHDFYKFLESLDNFSSKRVDIGIIGGCAMMFYGLRESTKDIDISILSGMDEHISRFIQEYSKENNIEIDFRPPAGFSSMLLNEEMFLHTKDVAQLKESFLQTYKFKELHLHILNPADFALVKIEAAAYRGGKDFEDAITLLKKFNIPLEAMIAKYQEYRPEIEGIPRMVLEFNMVMRHFYGVKEFDIKQLV